MADVDRLATLGIRGEALVGERVLTVELECQAAGDLTLELSYTVPQVGWYPLYDARVDFAKGKAELSSFAVVRQTTGEDWSDVQLTLSTARPSVGGRMPELTPWYLRPFVSRHRQVNAFGGQVIGSTAMLRRLTSGSGSPVKTMSFAAPLPTRRDRRWVPP